MRYSPALTRDPRKRPAKRTPRPSEPRNKKPAPADDGPEIQVSFRPAGRQTIEAISADLTGAEPDAPELEFRLVPAGRETLAAITADLLAESPLGARAPMTTVDYDQRAGEPSTGTRKRVTTLDYADEERPKSRQTTPGVAPPARPKPEKVGRDTLDAIATAMLDAGAPRARTLDLEAFELVTFVVRGADLGQLSSEAVRRELVAERLLHRLPVSSMELVDRVDVTPWTAGTAILRVWCRLGPPARG